MAIPGLGFLLAATLDGVHARFRWIPCLLMAAMVFFQIREKLDIPFGFGGQNEASVRFANTRSSQSQLRGLRLPPAMVTFLDETANVVATHNGRRRCYLP